MVMEDNKELLTELVLADDEEVTEDTINALSNNRGRMINMDIAIVS